MSSCSFVRLLMPRTSMSLRRLFLCLPLKLAAVGLCKQLIVTVLIAVIDITAEGAEQPGYRQRGGSGTGLCLRPGLRLRHLRLRRGWRRYDGFAVAFLFLRGIVFLLLFG